MTDRNIQNVSPIFVVGSARSGTSIVSKAIKEGANLLGYAEGHFFPMIIPVISAIDDYYSSNPQLALKKSRAISNIDREDLENNILQIFRLLYEKLTLGSRWIDKTPGVQMINAIPYIKQIYPDSCFVFAKRRGIENVMSRLKKFPNLPFESSCIRWKTCMESWLNIKEIIQNQAVEIDQREIALNPKDSAIKIGKCLQLSSSEIEDIEKVFIKDRPESTGGSESTKALDIYQTGWTDKQIEVFRRHCGVVSEAFKYSESSSYYLNN